jgi:hypothetical protein
VEHSHRSLRATLLVLFAANLSFAYMFLLDPAVVSRLYGDVPLDNMHLYLAMGLGSVLVVLAIGAFLAFLNPVKNAAVIIILILTHFSLFLTDVITLARVQMSVTALLPEMAYYLVISTLLIRFFPTKERIAKEEKKNEPTAKDANPLDAVAEPSPKEATESAES